MYKKEQLVRLLKSRIKKKAAADGHGDCCEYIKVDDHIGYKSFFSKEQRDRCYLLQKRAWKAGYAPQAYYKYNIDVSDFLSRFMKKYQWGYFTQHVPLIISDITDDQTIGYARIRALEGYIEKQATALAKELKAAGIDQYIEHMGNVGILNSKLVFVDFGEESCGILNKI